MLFFTCPSQFAWRCPLSEYSPHLCLVGFGSSYPWICRYQAQLSLLSPVREGKSNPFLCICLMRALFSYASMPCLGYPGLLQVTAFYTEQGQVFQTVSSSLHLGVIPLHSQSSILLFQARLRLLVPLQLEKLQFWCIKNLMRWNSSWFFQLCSSQSGLLYYSTFVATHLAISLFLYLCHSLIFCYSYIQYSSILQLLIVLVELVYSSRKRSPLSSKYIMPIPVYQQVIQKYLSSSLKYSF